MPTISRSRFQPLVTPSTALKTSARVSPCTAANLSSVRTTCRVPSLASSETPSAIRADTLPLGPSTRTVLPSTLYLTPAGSGIGFFPIRDIDSILHLACESRETVVSDQLSVISFNAPSFHCSLQYSDQCSVFLGSCDQLTAFTTDH